MRKSSIYFKRTKEFKKDGKDCLLVAEFELGDKCGNGICDFRVTGELMVNGVADMCGAIGDIVKEYMPEYGPICDLYLCSYLGEPLFPVGNGMYMIRKEDKEKAKRYLRITEEEYRKLKFTVDDKDYFVYLLITMGISDRWKIEADKAIALMEKEAGYEWENPYPGASRIKRTDMDKIAGLAADGYYDKERILERREDMRLDRIRKRKDEIKRKYDDDMNKRRKKLMVDLYMADLDIDNYIYYEHRDTVTLNWLDYKDKVSEERFEEIVRDMDKGKLPENTIFEMKE